MWFSDVYCDIDNELEVERISRLSIIKKNDKFIISYFNPFFVRCGIGPSCVAIGFSPAYNGAFSRNLDTVSSFQDDVIKYLYQDIMTMDY